MLPPVTDLRSLLDGVLPVTDAAADLAAAATDKSGLVGRPELVARPESAMQVAALLRLANEHRFVVVPRAAGTGRCGGAVPERGGVVLDVSGMASILEIDARERVARVEPGVVLGHLQAVVLAEGLYFPPDPASAADCMIGGAIATSAGGLRGAKYGTMKHYVLGLEVVLPTGEIVRTGARTRKSVVGYDLTSLMVGSEGTLGVVTEATLKLVPRPESAETLAAWFDTDDAARTGVAVALDVAAVPAALEFVDARALSAVSAHRTDFDANGARGLVLVECDGDPAAVARDITRYEEALKDSATRVERARDSGERDRLWAARRGISPAVTARWPHRMAEDICVPRVRFVEMIQALHRIAAEHGLSALGFGHAGDGNVHASILMDRGDDEERSRAREAVADVFRHAISLGGTLSAEHGIAMTKREYLPLELSGPAIEAQRAIKRALDPNDVLNPGKIFPAV